MKTCPARLLKLLCVCLLLTSCSSMPGSMSGQPVATDEPAGPAGTQTAAATAGVQVAVENTSITDAGSAVAVSAPADESVRPTIRKGSGVFVAGKGGGAQDALPDGDVTLNFENAELREFIAVIFGDILKVNYLIDPAVKGTVTLHTTRPVARAAVMPVLETVLERNGAALVVDQGVHKIVPLAKAEGEGMAPVVGRSRQGDIVGFGTQIVPLRHVAAGALAEMLTPFVPAGSSVRVDTARNLLMLSGPRHRLEQLLETIEIFDVDWLKGMSFGLFPVQYTDPATLVGDLEKIIGKAGESPLAGTVRLVAIARLNSVLVITHQSRQLAEVQQLIEQFDWGSQAAPGRRLYVYNLEHGKADHIASVLQELYGQDSGSGPASADDASTAGSGFRAATELTRPLDAVAGSQQQTQTQPAGDHAGVAADGSVAAESRGPVTIISDPDNNAILIMASPGDYRVIEGAIRKLDTPPRQVLINATIAEVTLTDNLDYGVKWFLDKHVRGSNVAELGFNAPPDSTAAGSGLALALLNGNGDARLFFDLLATESSVKFLSAPQVIVRDNQTATIRVGDQIPVTVRSSQSTLNPDSPLVTEVQFRDTGTLLTVTPHINAGGQITLEVSQEVSLPGTDAVTGGGGNVSIAQRSIDSTVTVQSGQTLVMGGLIRESSNDTKDGIPGLMKIPVLGDALFSSTSKDSNRTELLVTISPVLVENQQAAQNITRDLRNSMRRAAKLLDRRAVRQAENQGTAD